MKNGNRDVSLFSQIAMMEKQVSISKFSIDTQLRKFNQRTNVGIFFFRSPSATDIPRG